MSTSSHGPLPRVPAALRGMLDRLGRWLEDNPHVVDGFLFMAEQWNSPAVDNLAPAERFLRAMSPPNWWHLAPHEQVEARTFVSRTSVPLMWVPRATMVQAIMQTTTKTERDLVLCASRTTIVADVAAVLNDCTHERIEALTIAGREAATAAGGGQMRAAQALAAAIVGEIVVKHFGLSSFRDARARLEEELPDKVSMRFWRRASLQSALLAAIALSWTDPPPDGFNRHLSAHGVDPEQYTEANALEGLLLVAGLIRELQEVYVTGHGGVPPLSLHDLGSAPAG